MKDAAILRHRAKVQLIPDEELERRMPRRETNLEIVMNDGTRAVEIHHVAGNNHEDGMLMVYLPKEKLLIQADMFSPAPPNAPPPAAVNPNTVNLADNIARLGLAVEQHLPLHGRIVPMAELNKAIGRAQ